jgi:hypothetical protein
MNRDTVSEDELRTSNPVLWLVTLIFRITGFSDCIHRPVFYKLENTAFRKLDLFRSLGEGGETPTLLGPLGRANLSHRTTPVRFTITI